MGLVFAAMYWQRKAVATPVAGEKPLPTWKSQSIYPKVEEKVVAQAAAPEPPPADPNGPRLNALERQNKAILDALERQSKALEELKHPAAPRGPTTPAKPVTKPAPPGAPLHIVNKPDTLTSLSAVKEYTLAPGATKLPCTIETAMNSDVEGYFTAKVNTNVYDTATGRHLLVPQGSTILGNDQSSKLVYGNERMDTVSLKLTLPDGRSVDLGKAPVTDEQGIAGLTGSVDQHYLRLIGAVLIQGALRGGATAVSSAAAGAAGGQVITGVASTGAQTGTTITGPLLNTRPTIKVAAGQLCNVLLLSELKLPAMWQEGEPHDAVQAKRPPVPRR
jgi:type IV secretory pathway VirB10-like protein